MKQIIIQLYLVPALLCGVEYASAATVTSTFDADDEGWIITGDSTSGSASHVATGGNPGGFIQATDSVAGGVWYFSAPAKFLGNVSGAYNQILTFDLKQTGSGTQFNSFDVQLNGGGLDLRIFSLANPLPKGTWVSYSVLLSESADWFVGGNTTPATQTDMLTALVSLTKLRIRGEFITGSDIGRLDNVGLTVVPLPTSLFLFSTGVLSLLGYGRRTRRRALLVTSVG